MRVVISGATGFIGRRLLERLAPGDEASVLSRDPDSARRALPRAKAFRFDGGEAPPAEALAGRDAVFHLAGESVAGRWSAEKKRRIRDSRVLGTRALVDGIAALLPQDRPKLLVSASAIGYYGDRGEEILDENSPPGTDFLAKVCAEWEAEARRADELGVRVVTPRIGIVLGPHGGALEKMVTPFKLGVGGRLGHGAQWVSWIHVDDVVGLLLHAEAHEGVRGAMNAVAPNPVRNRDFARAIGATLSRPAVVPTPAFALRLALGEMAGQVLASQRVEPKVALSTGYRFLHPDLGEALRTALGAAA